MQRWSSAGALVARAALAAWAALAALARGSCVAACAGAPPGVRRLRVRLAMLHLATLVTVRRWVRVRLGLG